MSFLDIQQKIVGKMSKQINRFTGQKVSYTIVTDLTTDPHLKSVIPIFLGVTPTDFEFDETTGRKVKTTTDIFFVSRNSLVVSGAIFPPTMFDSFVIFGTTAPVFHVVKVGDLDQVSGEFELTVLANESEHAKG